jgi:DNA-binding transcriptional LysR family regulator
VVNIVTFVGEQVAHAPGVFEECGRGLHVTTRIVTPTEVGTRLIERLTPALGEVEAALEVVNLFRERPAGTLRLNVPVSAARLVP